MRMGKGFEKAMQEMIDYVKHQDLNVKRQFQKELEEVNEFLKNALQSFEQEDSTLNEKTSKNQERKEFIEEAKCYWKQKGKDFFITQELVNDDIVWRIGFYLKQNDEMIATLGNRHHIPEIPQEYMTNMHLLKAFLLSDILGDRKYDEYLSPPLPTHLEEGMKIKTRMNGFEITVKESAGQEFTPACVLLDDTDVIYE